MKNKHFLALFHAAVAPVCLINIRRVAIIIITNVSRSLWFAGFSLGDELGLAESLGNVEGSKRRALNVRTNVNNIGVLPASKMPVS